MIDEKRVLGLIPARGGSKRLPRKNVALLGDRPLIAWTIAAGQQSRILDRLVMSSDDPEIIAVAKEYGCEVPFRRPTELATDSATSEAMARHALSALDQQYDYMVLLQPTSPFRRAEDIDRCIQLCHETGGRSVVSVCEPDVPQSHLVGVQADGTIRLASSGGFSALRQFTVNGAIYVLRTVHLLDDGRFVEDGALAYAMPRANSVDIDTGADMERAAFQLATRI